MAIMKTTFFGVIMLGVGFLAGQYMESHRTVRAPKVEKSEMSFGAPVGDVSDPVVVLKRVIAGKFADKETELLSGTELVRFKGQCWRMIKLRTRNGIGAPVFADYFVGYDEEVPIKWVRLGDIQDYPGESLEETKAFIAAFMAAESMKL